MDWRAAGGLVAARRWSAGLPIWPSLARKEGTAEPRQAHHRLFACEGVGGVGRGSAYRDCVGVEVFR